jgi:hypothetical protein
MTRKNDPESYDLVTSPNYIVMSAASEFKHKTRRVHDTSWPGEYALH